MILCVLYVIAHGVILNAIWRLFLKPSAHKTTTIPVHEKAVEPRSVCDDDRAFYAIKLAEHNALINNPPPQQVKFRYN